MSEMRSIGPGENSSGHRYLSLENINAAHIKLLQRSKDPDNPELMDEVERYVASVCAAGAILEADADRDAAQKLVTYWSNTLYRAEREPKETLLEEFNEEECPDLPNDKCPYRTLETGGEGLPTGPPGLLRLTRECLRLLEHDHIVAVVGQSGGSRGFLIFEGVLPKLSAGAIEGSADWRVIEFTPFADPLRELVAAILPETVGAEEVSRQCDLFRKDSGVLKQLLDHSGDAPALLIVNRFENFFNVSRDDASSFFHNLQMLVESRKHCVILKVRSDYLSQVASDSTLSRLLERNQLLLAFTPQELRQLVEEPAKLVGLHFETGLVDRLVQDVMGDPRALQLLRFTLLQLWDHRVRNRITWESYRKLGGGRVAVEKTAEQIFLQQVSDRPEELFSSIWTAFIRLNVGRDVSFLAVRREDLHREVRSNKSLSALSAETIDKTLDELVVAKLLNQKKGDRSKDDSFSIAQASLTSCWPRMWLWIEQKREINLRWLRLRSAADQWHSSNELPVLLWGGSALEEVERDPKLQLPEFALVKNFTQASRRFVERNRLRRNALWAFFALSLAAFLGICWSYSVSVTKAREAINTAEATALANLEKQKKETMEKQKDLSMLQLSAASTLFGEEVNNTEARERDPSGALVWYSKAHELVESTKTGLNEKDREVVMDNYSSRLAFAFREAPRLLHCLPRTKLSLATMSKNGKWALTVDSKETEKPEVNLWDLESANSEPQPIKHDDKVWLNTARFSADSNFLVTGEKSVNESVSDNSVLRLWQLSKSGNLPYSAKGDWNIPGQLGDLVAIQADGKRLLAIARIKDPKESNSSDGTKGDDPKLKSFWSVYLVNVESAGRRNAIQRVKTFESATPACPVTSLEFSAAGNKFFVAANKPDNKTAEISIWENNDLSKESQTIPLEFPVSFACFVRQGAESDEDNYVLSCSGKMDSNTGEAVLWPILSTNNSIQEKRYRHNGGVVHASASSDQQRVVTACYDNKAYILDLKTKGMDLGFANLLSHPANVVFTAFSPNGLTVATACRDQKVRIWNTSNAKLLYTLECGGTPVQLVFSDDGCRLFAQAGPDKALIWDLLTDALPAKTIHAEGGISHAVFDETLRSLVTVQDPVGQHTDRRVQVWNVVDDGTTKPKEFKIEWNTDIEAIAVGPEGDRVAICGNNKVGFYWDSGKEHVLVENPNMVVRNVCFSHDGSKVLVAGNNNPIDLEGIARVWRFDDDLNEPLSVIRGSMGELKYVCFSPDAERVLTCGGTPNSVDSAESIRGEAIVWRINTNPATQIQKLTRTKLTDSHGKAFFRGHDGPILFGAFSLEENGRYVVTTSVDDTACIWDSENGGAPLATLGRETSTQYHTADVVSAAFAPKEINQVVTVGKDGRAILWDWKAKKSHVLKPDGNPLKGVFFSKNGLYFLTTSEGTKARVWDRLVAMSHMSDSSDSSTNVSPVSPQIAVLEHSGPILTGGVHPDAPNNRFLALSYVGTARISDVVIPRPPSESRVANHGVQIKDWNVEPVDDELMPVLVNASSALAQRKVKSESQTLEVISLEELVACFRQSAPKLQSMQSEDSRLKRRLLWNRRHADRAEVEGDWFAAAWHLGKLIELGDQSPELLNRRARCYAQNGWYRYAIIDWENVCETTDNSIAVMAYAGLARSEAELAMKGIVGINDRISDDRRRENGNRAIEYFDKALQLDESQFELFEQRAHLKGQLGEIDTAINDYTILIERSGDSGKRLGDLCMERAKLYKQAKRDDLAFADYQTAGDSFAKVFDASSFAAAIRAFENALRLSPDSNRDDVHLRSGKLMVQARQYRLNENPERLIREGIKELTGILTPNSDWNLPWKIASVYKKLQEFENANKYFSMALDQAEKQSAKSNELRPLYNEYADTLKKVADWNQLSEVLSREIEAFADDSNLQLANLRERASAYFMLKKWELAAKDLEQSIRIQKQAKNPSNEAIRSLHTLRAATIAEIPNWKEAEAELKNAFELTSNNDFQQRVLALYRLAVVLLMDGNTEGYRQCCRQLLEEYKKATSGNSQTVTSDARNNVAWTLALANDSGIPAAEASEIARIAVDESKETQTYRNTLRTAKFREQKYDEVLQSWNASETDEFRDPVAYAADSFVLAMTHFFQKNESEARKWLSEGIEAVKKVLPNSTFRTESLDDMSIWSRLELRVLQIEAERSLGQRKEENN